MRSRARLRTIAFVGLPGAVIVALGMLYLGIGPDHIETCTDQSGFERTFYGDRLGAVDGADSSGCVTPSGGAYAVAAVGGLVAIGLVLLWTRWGQMGHQGPETKKPPVI